MWAISARTDLSGPSPSSFSPSSISMSKRSHLLLAAAREVSKTNKAKKIAKKPKTKVEESNLAKPETEHEATDLVSVEDESLMQKYKNLNLALKVLGSRFSRPSIPLEKLGSFIRGMGHEAPSESDLDTMLRVCPNAFLCEWTKIVKVDKLEWSLCVQPNKEWKPAPPIGDTSSSSSSRSNSKASDSAESSDKKAMTSENAFMAHLKAARRRQRREREQQTKQQKQARVPPPLGEGTSSLPPRPDAAAGDTGTTTTTDTTTSTISAPAAAVGHRKRGETIMALLGLSPQRSQLSATSSHAQQHSGDLPRQLNMQEIEALATESTSTRRQREEDAECERRRVQHVNRVRFLPKLCDVLHTKSVVAKKSIFYLEPLVSELSSTTDLHVDEVKRRLRVCVQVLPDFMKELPVSDLLPDVRVELNTARSYAKDLRKYIIETCASSLGAL